MGRVCSTLSEPRESPYKQIKINSEYVIGLLALGRYSGVPALGPDFVPQESLESGYVFYWDGDTSVHYNEGPDISFGLLISFKK